MRGALVIEWYLVQYRRGGCFIKEAIYKSVLRFQGGGL